MAIIFIRTLALNAYALYARIISLSLSLTLAPFECSQPNEGERGRESENVVDPVAYNATQPLQTDNAMAASSLYSFRTTVRFTFIHMDVHAARPQTPSLHSILRFYLRFLFLVDAPAVAVVVAGIRMRRIVFAVAVCSSLSLCSL